MQRADDLPEEASGDGILSGQESGRDDKTEQQQFNIGLHNSAETENSI